MMTIKNKQFLKSQVVTLSSEESAIDDVDVRFDTYLQNRVNMLIIEQNGNTVVLDMEQQEDLVKFLD